MVKVLTGPAGAWPLLVFEGSEQALVDDNSDRPKKWMTFWPALAAVVAGIYSAGIFSSTLASNTDRIVKLERSDADKALVLNDLQSDVRIIKLILSKAYPGLVPSE